MEPLTAPEQLHSLLSIKICILFVFPQKIFIFLHEMHKIHVPLASRALAHNQRQKIGIKKKFDILFFFFFDNLNLLFILFINIINDLYYNLFGFFSLVYRVTMMPLIN